MEEDIFAQQDKEWNQAQRDVLDEIEQIYARWVQADTPGERRDLIQRLRQLYIKNLDERVDVAPDLFMMPAPATLVFREKVVEIFLEKKLFKRFAISNTLAFLAGGALWQMVSILT